MRELHAEGLATHGDPESWTHFPKGRRQALTGAHASWVLSREITTRRCRRRPHRRKAKREGALCESPSDLTAVRDPKRARNLLVREPGDPLTARGKNHEPQRGDAQSVESRR